MEDSCTASSAQNRKPKAHWTDEERAYFSKSGKITSAKRNLQVYVAMAECLRAQEIARFLGRLPINDRSLMDETVDDEYVSVEMLIDSMQQEPPSPADDESSMTQAAVSEPPSPPPYESRCQPSALPSPSSPLPAAPSTDHRLQTAPPNSEAAEHHHQTPAPNSHHQTPPPNSHQTAKPSRHATQKSLLQDLVNTNCELCADLTRSRREEMELKRMEMEILQE
ncbi:uncharacterized protein LOC144125203 [Amblyomma americanum]